MLVNLNFGMKLSFISTLVFCLSPSKKVRIKLSEYSNKRLSFLGDWFFNALALSNME
jgi:hypothetical protein